MEKDGLSPLSALVKSGGTFAISLNEARTRDLSDLFSQKDISGTFKLFVENGSSGRAEALVDMNIRDSIPVIDIPGNYNFTQGITESVPEVAVEPILLNEINNENKSKFNFENLPIPIKEEVTLIYPKPLEKINVSDPEFLGTAPPGRVVTITVESDPQTTRILTDSDGGWAWSPPQDLEPGEHTLTVSYINSAGVLQKIVRKFTVAPALAQDNNLGFTASESAQLSPSPTPTPTLRTSSTPTPTGLVPTSSPTPTVIKSPTPTPTPTVPVVADNQIPVAGNMEYTLVLIAGGWMLMGLGVFVLRRQKGNR
jgi:hypothetical protein